jgi:hypothetical protein
MSRGRPYLHVLWLYSKVMLQDSVDAVPRTDLKVLIEILTMNTIMKEKGIFSG